MKIPFVFRHKSGKQLPPTVDAIKTRANAVFEKQKYNQAILLYNQALAMAPDAPVLYGNRAAAFMKRSWLVVGYCYANNICIFCLGYFIH